MADFTININEIPPSYLRVSTSVAVEECELQDESYAVSLESLQGLFYSVIRGGTYNGAAWKTLHISSAVNNYQYFELRYNGMAITSPIDIDIAGLGAGDPIPLLSLESSGTSDIKSTRVITLIFAISDINDVMGPTLSSSLQLQGLKCVVTAPSDPTISGASYSIITDCGGEGQKVNFTVNGANSTTYKYQIATLLNGNHGYTATLKNTDTDAIINPSVSAGTGTTVNGTVTTNGTGIINLQWEVCPRPPLNDGDNCVSVSLTLYKEDGVTLNTSQRVSLQPCYLS